MFRLIFFKNLIVLSLVFNSILCNVEDDGRIIFDGPVNFGHRRSLSLEREIELAQEYSQIENVQDFISRINGIPQGESLVETVFASRFGGDGRSNLEIPKAATCSPQLQPVSLKNSTVASSAVYIPSCTRVPRCGGCCGHASISCQPTATVLRNFQVIVTEYDVANRLTYKKKEIVQIEEHTKCACACKTKAEHCNANQEYLPKECRCACRNIDDESKCLRSNDTKHWDEDSCTCKCRGSSECTTGSFYDHVNCSCKKIGGIGNRRFDNREDQRPYLTSYDFGTRTPGGRVPPVYTVSANDPRRRHKDDPEK